jgi:hypothetical protein
MVNKKFYYLIEDIDIDGDTNPDGFLITKYKIDKKNKDKIFLKSKYVSFQNFKKKLNKIKKTLKGGDDFMDFGDNNHKKHPHNHPHNYNNYQNHHHNHRGYNNFPPPHAYNNVPFMNNNEFNNYMNNNKYPNQYNAQNQPQVIVAHHNRDMGTALAEGFSGGLGAGLGLGIMDGIFDMF